jgi:hypothetical protein
MSLFNHAAKIEKAVLAVSQIIVYQTSGLTSPD